MHPYRSYVRKNLKFVKLIKNFGKSSRGRRPTQGLSKIFRAPYIGCIARSSLQ